MKKFKFEDYQGKYAMWCKNEKEAKKFCEVMHKSGRTWIDKKYYIDNCEWKNEYHAYLFNEGRCGDTFIITTYPTYIILNFSDFDWSEDKIFTKADLKTGDFIKVKFSNETKVAVCVNIDNKMFVDEDGKFSVLTNDFLEENMLSVHRPTQNSHYSFSRYYYGDLIYQKEQHNAVEMTVEEISKALGKKVKVVG